ncbi:MAG: hypothetical protein AAF367_07665 [Pseudomonadota bacterium]
MLGILTALALPKAPSAQSHGAVTISIDESLGSVFGLARIFINDEPQGVLSAGCCMYLQVAAGTHDLTLRWSDHEVTAEFTSNGIDTIAFHLTAERALILLEE